MPKTLEKIEAFLEEHHLLSLATSADNRPQVSNLFYVYETKTQSFIVASDTKTQHIKNVMLNPDVACSVALETDEVGKIQGVQCQAKMVEALDDAAKKCYFDMFPYARVMLPKLWRIQLHYIKFTDNRLGFGKKLIWTDELSE